MVECLPHVVDAVGHPKGDEGIVGRIDDFDEDAVLASLDLTVFDDHAGVTLRPPLTRCLQRVEVFDSVIEL
jgi:hypothetical protein